MVQWIADHSIHIGSASMCILGAVCSYLKAYELADVTWAREKHCRVLHTRILLGSFASLLIWYAIGAAATKAWVVPEPAIPLLIGLASYNGGRVVDFMTTTSFDWIRRRLGLSEAGPPK